MNTVAIISKFLIWLTVISILSWILIHLLAIGGPILAIAYPLWWLFLPRSSLCLLCRAKRDHDYCQFCKASIDKSRGLSPRTLHSAVMNGLVIFMFSLISLGVIAVESHILHLLGFPPTERTVSFIIPTKGQYRIGEIFSVPIDLTGIETPINAIQADLSFDTTRLQLLDISTDNSFATVFIQKEIDNEAGYGRITGGVPNPGFEESGGRFATAIFLAHGAGLGVVEFLPSSRVLANDGRASDVVKDFSSVAYLIHPEPLPLEEQQTQRELLRQSQAEPPRKQVSMLTFYDEGSVLGEAVDQIGLDLTAATSASAEGSPTVDRTPEEPQRNILEKIIDAVARWDRAAMKLWKSLIDAQVITTPSAQ